MGERDKSGAWREHMHATVRKTDNQQGPLLHSTGNSTRRSVMNCVRKASEKE